MGAGAEPPQPFKVLGGGIALVAVESIVRKRSVQIDHQRVAVDFGQDAGRRDRRLAGITADDRATLTSQGGRSIAVDQGKSRWGSERQNRSLHADQRGLQDVQFIDQRNFDRLDSPGHGLIADLSRQ